MIIVKSIPRMQKLVLKLRGDGKSVGFVPTMGALHEGHLSLIKQARRDNDIVVVSIFVNPIQFEKNEDFKKYPRDFKKDFGLCRREKTDILFLPDTKQMYREPYKTYVEVENLGKYLCGRFRPGHFKGVTTVLAKLFNIVSPSISYFGQKDFQQALIVRRMAEDLNFSTKVMLMPTIREKDDLAMSSRNIYLNTQERKDAVILHKALILAKGMVLSGEPDARIIISRMKKLINSVKSATIQYISVVDVKDLQPVQKIKSQALVALSAYIGKTRLIDNILVRPF